MLQADSLSFLFFLRLYFFVGFHAFVRVAYFAFTRTLLIGTLISPLRAVFCREPPDNSVTCVQRSKWEKKKVRLSRWLIHLSCRLIALVISENEKKLAFLLALSSRTGRLLLAPTKIALLARVKMDGEVGQYTFFSFNFNNFLRSTL